MPFPDGNTCTDNMITLCRRHHRLEHEGGRHVAVDPNDPDLLAWTSPTGRTHSTRPDSPPPPNRPPPYPDDPPF